MSNQYKQFTINNLTDALLVLGTLISASITNLDKFDEYTKEALTLHKKHKNDEVIPGKEYEDLHDKALFRQRELLEYMADAANDIFSYLPLRKKLMKMGFLTRQLDKETAEILNELHTIRNGTFHNVQSRLVAEKEAMKKTLPKELVGIAKIEPQLNPIIVNRHKAYTKDMLKSFIYHNMLRSAQFLLILDEMKRDYQDMYDQLDHPQVVFTNGAELLVEGCESPYPVKTVVYEQNYGWRGNESDVANISMAIQKGKYDGTMASFEKHTGKDVD